MVNLKKLKLKLKEKGLSVEDVSKTMGINRATLYRKIKNDGETFTVRDIDKLSRVLGLQVDEINEIFLLEMSHKCDIRRSNR